MQPQAILFHGRRMSLVFSEGFIFQPCVDTVVRLSKSGSSKRSVDKIRVSSGSAISLGLIEGLLDVNPTTAYLLTYFKGKCTANCGFCSQAKSSKSRGDLLSRVAWPVFATTEVMPKLVAAIKRGRIKRVCIQTLNYPGVLEDLLVLVKKIRQQHREVPLSISCQPSNRDGMERLARTGVERIGIALDAAAIDIFDRVKGNSANGPYSWDKHHDALLEAVEVFGKGNVSTHLMVGLGETERQMIETIQWCVDNSICPALFSFTPIPGTTLEHRSPPTVHHYRRIQLARYLIIQGKAKSGKMSYDEEDRIVDFGVPHEQLKDAVQNGEPFLTSGCPNCNRPYYNEKPSGPLYNFPRQPTIKEIKIIKNELRDNL